MIWTGKIGIQSMCVYTVGYIPTVSTVAVYTRPVDISTYHYVNHYMHRQAVMNTVSAVYMVPANCQA